MLIVNCVLGDAGWSPIHHMVALASRLFEAEVLVAQKDLPSFLAKVSSVLRRRSARAHSQESCLLICAGPADLARLLSIDEWRGRFKFLAAWTIDSFWLDHIPVTTRLSKPFDHFFVTSLEDVKQWNKITGVPTTWLPWGTDALKLGSGAPDRKWDITRLGRQPAEWNDDVSNASAARLLGMSYRGRVPGDGLTALQNQELVMSLYGDSKYLLAFSNAANPERWTHPTRQYLTGRWVDALACGAIVAGISPRSPDVDELLWQGATLELGSVRRQEGLEMIASALKIWTPKSAMRNNVMALKKLDWRWRLKTIAETFALETTTLRGELERLSMLVEEREDAAL
ncbi:MAG TPA: hypothetical protein VNH18_09175 [Bryobacteraceae bacterium]|nr:hypothetical protein [Bryobacteraceae bacterium]